MDDPKAVVSAPSTTLPKTFTEGLCSKKDAAAAAASLIGCFADLGNLEPDIYATAVAEEFMGYEKPVVANTVRQLRRTYKSKFPPSIAVIVGYLDNGGWEPPPPPEPEPRKVYQPGERFRTSSGNIY